MNPRQRRQANARERLSSASNATLSHHALQRTKELGFTEADVHRCIARYEQTYTCPEAYGPNRRMYQRGHLGVVLTEDTRIVVTVLLRTGQRWKHGIDTQATLFGRAG